MVSKSMNQVMCGDNLLDGSSKQLISPTLLLVQTEEEHYQCQIWNHLLYQLRIKKTLRAGSREGRSVVVILKALKTLKMMTILIIMRHLRLIRTKGPEVDQTQQC